MKSSSGIRDQIFEVLDPTPGREDSDHSRTVTSDEIEATNFDLKAVNPNAKLTEDTRTPEQLLGTIDAMGREVAEAMAELRSLLARAPAG